MYLAYTLSTSTSFRFGQNPCMRLAVKRETKKGEPPKGSLKIHVRGKLFWRRGGHNDHENVQPRGGGKQIRSIEMSMDINFE